MLKQDGPAGGGGGASTGMAAHERRRGRGVRVIHLLGVALGFSRRSSEGKMNSAAASDFHLHDSAVAGAA